MSGYAYAISTGVLANKRKRGESQSEKMNTTARLSPGVYDDLIKDSLDDPPKDRSKSFKKRKHLTASARAVASRQSALQDNRRKSRQSAAKSTGEIMREELDADEFAEQYEEDDKKAEADIHAFNQPQSDLSPVGPFLGEDINRFPGHLKKHDLTKDDIRRLKERNNKSRKLYRAIKLGKHGKRGGKTRKHRNKKNKTKRRR